MILGAWNQQAWTEWLREQRQSVVPRPGGRVFVTAEQQRDIAEVERGGNPGQAVSAPTP